MLPAATQVGPTSGEEPRMDFGDKGLRGAAQAQTHEQLQGYSAQLWNNFGFQCRVGFVDPFGAGVAMG